MERNKNIENSVYFHWWCSRSSQLQPRQRQHITDVYHRGYLENLILFIWLLIRSSQFPFCCSLRLVPRVLFNYSSSLFIESSHVNALKTSKWECLNVAQVMSRTTCVCGSALRLISNIFLRYFSLNTRPTIHSM